MTTETASNKPTLVSRYATLATALQAAPDTEFVLGGKTYPKTAVVSALSAYTAANQTAAAEKLKWKKAVADEKAALAGARPLRALVKTYLQGKLGKSSAELTSYGFDPAKAPKTTVKAKATGQAKSTATREARNTMGALQKKDVKGDVIGITVTPVKAVDATPKAPSAPAAPTSPKS